MPYPKKKPDVWVKLVGGPEDGEMLSVPADTAEIGRWHYSTPWYEEQVGQLYRYAVDMDSGTATLVPG